MKTRTFLALMLIVSSSGLSGQVCHAQAKPLAPPVPAAKLDPVTASFALVPGMRLTSDRIPLALRLCNNTGKPLRVLDLFTPELFAAAVYFELREQKPTTSVQYQPNGSTTITILTTNDFFGSSKVSFYAGYRYKFIKIKPGQTKEIQFDLAELTLDKRRIPPGTYTLGGLFGINRGYPPSVGRTDDIYSGGTEIPPITLTVEKECAKNSVSAPAG